MLVKAIYYLTVETGLEGIWQLFSHPKKRVSEHIRNFHHVCPHHKYGSYFFKDGEKRLVKTDSLILGPGDTTPDFRGALAQAAAFSDYFQLKC